MNIVMSSQNHAMKTNTVKTSTKKLRKVKPSLTNSIAILHVSDAQNGRSPAYSPTPSTGQRPHAFARRVTGWRASRKLSRATHGQRAAGRFDMRGPRLELVHAADLLAHAFERRGEHLLALQGALGCARKAC